MVPAPPRGHTTAPRTTPAQEGTQPATERLDTHTQATGTQPATATPTYCRPNTEKDLPAPQLEQRQLCSTAVCLTRLRAVEGSFLPELGGRCRGREAHSRRLWKPRLLVGSPGKGAGGLRTEPHLIRSVPSCKQERLEHTSAWAEGCDHYHHLPSVRELWEHVYREVHIGEGGQRGALRRRTRQSGGLTAHVAPLPCGVQAVASQAAIDSAA